MIVVAVGGGGGGGGGGGVGGVGVVVVVAAAAAAAAAVVVVVVVVVIAGVAVLVHFFLLLLSMSLSLSVFTHRSCLLSLVRDTGLERSQVGAELEGRGADGERRAGPGDVAARSHDRGETVLHIRIPGKKTVRRYWCTIWYKRAAHRTVGVYALYGRGAPCYGRHAPSFVELLA